MTSQQIFAFILDLVRIFRPEQRRWVVRVLVLAGVGLVSHRLWEPIVEALIEKELSIRVAYSDVPGWILIGLGLAFHLSNLFLDRAGKKQPRFREDLDNLTFSLGARGISIGYSKDQLLRGANEPFQLGGHSPVKVYAEKGVLYADVEVYQGAGLPAIRITKNRLSGRPTHWDQNSNSEALEVVDENNNPVYQFIYRSPEHIVVNGIFPFPGGLLVADDQGVQLNPAVPFRFQVKRIFRYPAWKYPGEYET